MWRNSVANVVLPYRGMKNSVRPILRPTKFWRSLVANTLTQEFYIILEDVNMILLFSTDY